METLKKIFNKSSILIPDRSDRTWSYQSAQLRCWPAGIIQFWRTTSLLDKLFSTPYNIGEAIRAITPLIFTGLAVSFAFRTGLFNIGVEGQFVMGMTGATIVGVLLDLPWYIHAPLAVITGAVFGGLWAAIAGYLKAKRGVNEVISSIMLNWIALVLIQLYRCEVPC